MAIAQDDMGCYLRSSWVSNQRFDAESIEVVAYRKGLMFSSDPGICKILMVSDFLRVVKTLDEICGHPTRK